MPGMFDLDKMTQEKAKEIMKKKHKILEKMKDYEYMKNNNNGEQDWIKFCEFIEFDYSEAFDREKYMTSKFRMLLTEIKFRSLGCEWSN